MEGVVIQASEGGLFDCHLKVLEQLLNVKIDRRATNPPISFHGSLKLP